MRGLASPSGTIRFVRVDLAIMFGAFVLASLLAAALGAVNLGQIAFALATVLVIIKRP